MKNKYKLLILVGLTIIIVSCIHYLKKSKYAYQKPINIEKVDYITINNNTNDTIKSVTKRLITEQCKVFIEKWNNAKPIGPYIFICQYKIEVYLKDKTNRSFRVNGRNIKEENDWAFDLIDNNYINQLWNTSK